MSMGVLIDTTRCTGCEECIVACKKENDLGEDRMWRGQESIGGLSATRWSTIIPRPDGHYVRNQCRHCLEPACVSACVVGALTKLPEGPVVYDENRCMGCRYCMLACPYSIPRYDWDRNTPLVQKCKMCEHRVREGKAPSCVEACPEKAMMFGSREAILAEAHKRIKDNPGKYIDHVWGEKEFGGTSMVYVSDIPLDFLMAKPGSGERVLPELSWAALKKVPGVVVGAGALMAGTYWVIGRRMKMAALQSEAGEAARAAAEAAEIGEAETTTEKNDE